MRAPALFLLALAAVCCTSTPPAPDLKALVRQRPTRQFAGADLTSGWLPLLHAHKPVVQGWAGETEVRVLLDTGAGITVVDEALARTFDLEFFGTGSAVGTGGETASMEVVRGLHLRLGDLLLGDVPAIAIDLAPVRQSDQGPPAIILGTQVFHTLVAELDFPGRRVQLRESSPDAAPAARDALPLHLLDDERVAIEVSLEGRTPRRFLLDTGADGEVDLFTARAGELGLLDGRPRETRQVGGVGGMVEAHRIRLTSVTLAGSEVRDVDCDVYPARDDTMRELAGMVGSRLLARFQVVLDYRHRRMWLR